MNKYLGIILLVATMALIFYLGTHWPKLTSLEPPSWSSKSTSSLKIPPESYISEPPKPYEIKEPSKTSTPPEPPEGFKTEDLSPYFKKIRISGVSASVFYKSPSRITLTTAYNLNEKINISGWRLKSNREEFIIPQAIEIYDPFGLSQASDIKLEKDQRVYIYSSVSAFGRNLRLNKCIGYLENTYDFIPSLPRNCPRIARSEIYDLGGACQNYLMSLSSCEVPNSNNTIIAWNEKCRQFVERANINYKGCFDRYRADLDFLSKEWWVWAGVNIFDPYHDRVLLLDKEGLLVDVYIY